MRVCRDLVTLLGRETGDPWRDGWLVAIMATGLADPQNPHAKNHQLICEIIQVYFGVLWVYRNRLRFVLRITNLYILQWGQNTKFHRCLGPERHGKWCCMYEIALWTYNIKESWLYTTSGPQLWPSRITFFSKQRLHSTTKRTSRTGHPQGMAPRSGSHWFPWGWGWEMALRVSDHQGSNPGLSWWHAERVAGVAWKTAGLPFIPTCTSTLLDTDPLGFGGSVSYWNSQKVAVHFRYIRQNWAPLTVKSCSSPRLSNQARPARHRWVF